MGKKNSNKWILGSQPITSAIPTSEKWNGDDNLGFNTEMPYETKVW